MKQLLLIGMNPYTLDFSLPGFPVGMTPELVMEGIRSEQEKLAAIGYNLETYLPNLDNPEIDALIELLQQKHYDAIIIGAGIRVPPSNFILFELLVNVVHEFAHSSKIIFNTKPSDNLVSVQRWL